MNRTEIQIRVYYCMMNWLKENGEEIPQKLEDLPGFRITEESLERTSLFSSIEAEFRVTFPRDKIWTCNAVEEIVKELIVLTAPEFFYTDEMKK